MKFCLVYSKNRKRFDKYVKKANISNKLVIDIKKMMDEEEIGPDQLSSDFFKLLIWKKFEWAIEKGKDVYYIPWSKNPQFSPRKTLTLKRMMPPHWRFDMLLFHNDFKTDHKLSQLYAMLPEFDGTHIVEE